MIQLTPHMRILAALSPADFRKGIDGLAAVCRAGLHCDPFAGTVFVFRNRRATSIRLLVYDGQGFWLCTKRLSRGRFRYWPSAEDGVTQTLSAAHVHLLLSGGDPKALATALPPWRRIEAVG